MEKINIPTEQQYNQLMDLEELNSHEQKTQIILYMYFILRRTIKSIAPSVKVYKSWG